MKSNHYSDISPNIVSNQLASWDYVILTASNKNQANAYKRQLENRLKHSFMSKSTHWGVISDPEDKRVGSGGATFNALRYVRSVSGDSEFFKHNKILVIHSGGDSKRVPTYSVGGKLFMPFQKNLDNGTSATLFDELIESLSCVPEKINSGMLIISGDILVMFDPEKLNFLECDAVALSVNGSVDVGKNHGVFLTDCNNNLEKFLHKKAPDILKRECAVDKQGMVKLDTGSIWLGEKILENLFGLIETKGNVSTAKFNKFVNDKVCLSFYADIIYPLACNAVFEDYLKETPEKDFSDELMSCRKMIWDAINQFNLKVNLISHSEFLHFGTLNEIHKIFCSNIDNFKPLGWHRLINTNCSFENITVNNSFIDSNVCVGNNSYVIDSRLMGNTKVGKNSILYGVSAQDRVIPPGVIVDGFKLCDGKYVARILGVNDNPKLTFEDGCSFLGLPFETVIKQLRLNENDIWEPNQKRDLWNARLFCKGEAPQKALDCALALHDSVINGNPLQHPLELSFFSSAQQADLDSMLNKKVCIYNEVTALKIIESIKSRSPVNELKASFGKVLSNSIIEKLIELASGADKALKIRVLYYCSELCNNNLSNKLRKEYLSELREWLIGVYTQHSDFSKEKMVPYAKNELPVRVNWGGTWTDTPPYSYENGGGVLNAAILLDDKFPVKTEIKSINEKHIVLENLDVKAIQVFKDIEELQKCTNTDDPFALSKACLIACGIIPQKGGNLDKITDKFGGFHLTTKVENVAQGSGLGISSILACSCLIILYRFFGVDYDRDKLLNATLCAEQLMTTGGGWQDQAGGYLRGIKLTSSEKYDKSFNLKTLELTAETKNELQRRFVLINTGQNRLARDILRSVVEGYIGADTDALKALEEIRKLPKMMITELEEGNIYKFAKLLTLQYELTCKMNKDFTTPYIEEIFKACNPLIDGKMICGAGGGGFIQIILKKDVSVEGLSKRLDELLSDNSTVIRNCKFFY